MGRGTHIIDKTDVVVWSRIDKENGFHERHAFTFYGLLAGLAVGSARWGNMSGRPCPPGAAHRRRNQGWLTQLAFSILEEQWNPGDQVSTGYGPSAPLGQMIPPRRADKLRNHFDWNKNYHRR